MISREKLRRLPCKPGAYLIKDASGRILYVGKAVDIRRRVGSHFGARAAARPFSPSSDPGVADVECIVTDTEKEALLLEETLIKEHRPRYNISLKDSTQHAHLRLSLNEEYPCLEVTRNVRKDGARYFGPYTSADAARRTVRFLQRIFPLRECGPSEFARRTRPCIKYQIRRCSGPCVGKIGKEEYGEIVRRVALFLSGKTGSLLRLFEEEMQREAEALHFENAARLRDAVAAIRSTIERQKSVSRSATDLDALGLYREGEGGEAAILFVRAGKLIGMKAIALERAGAEDAGLVRAILTEHYLGGAFIPARILLPSMPSDRGAIERALAEERAGPVRLVRPRGGDSRALVAMAGANAEAAFAARREEDFETSRLLQRMQRMFRLPAPPRDIECVDVSDMGGASAVGSVVAFRDGRARREGYRRFRIATVRGADDCRMIYEVLSRRVRRGLEGWGLPDLFVIDGGRGQLQAARAALDGAGARRITALAIAKERGRAGGMVPERVYLAGRKNPVPLKAADPVTLLLMRLRDEAHRTAVRAHRAIRGRKALASELDGIPGIGEKRKALLLAAFGGVKGAARASPEELRRVLRSAAAAKSVMGRLRAVNGGEPPSGHSP